MVGNLPNGVLTNGVGSGIGRGSIADNLNVQRDTSAGVISQSPAASPAGDSPSDTVGAAVESPQERESGSESKPALVGTLKRALDEAFALFNSWIDKV